MYTNWKEMLWQQFGAAIQTLEKAIADCPEEIWSDQESFHQYWYMAYHTLFFLDYYISESPDSFSPPEPFTLSELDPKGVLPDRVYTKEELLRYLEYGREKCRTSLRALTEEKAAEKSRFRDHLTVLGDYLYTMRHVQHHAAQMNLLLRQKVDSAPRWVSKAAGGLDD
jgi:hypothetical protein